MREQGKTRPNGSSKRGFTGGGRVWFADSERIVYTPDSSSLSIRESSALRKQIPPKLRSKKEAIKILSLMRLATAGKTTLGKMGNAHDSSPFRVLISTMLSARTKDAVTESSSERLFARFPDAESIAKANPREVARIIRPVLYHNVKGKRVVEVSKILLERFSGKVPETLAGLLELPGVGRKTANCVLVYGFGVPAIPVDVHVHRVSNRIGLVRTIKPEDTEAELGRIYDRKYWLDVNELFVRFGQTTCKPLKPLCSSCPVNESCNYYLTLDGRTEREQQRN